MTEDQAVQIARSTAEAEGWPFLEPVQVMRRKPWFRSSGGTWEIFSNARFLGGNVRVVIEDQTGEVRSKSFIPR